MTPDEAVVYIVDDDRSFRTSLERLLAASGYVAIGFESASAFLAEARLRRPACLLLDVRLPDLDGLDVQVELNARNVTLPIVFMTGHGSIPMSVRAMKQGAIEFLPKPFRPEELHDAIASALERDVRLCGAERLAGRAQDLIAALTPREKEVLRWVIAGKLNKQIAFALGTSEKTIKVHRSRVMEKTNVNSVADLVRLAEQAGVEPAV